MKCPKCGGLTEIDGKSCSCGWKSGKVVVSQRLSEVICEFNDHGFRCNKRGALSPSTNGSGPWYCSEHAWVFLGGEPQQGKKPVESDIAEEAAKYCAERGLDTVEKMKAFVKLNFPRIDKPSAKV